jgi:hypothetical protein
MSATSSCDQETDKASRDEAISGHAGCRLDSRVNEILVSIPCGGRATPEALIAHVDSAQNAFPI